MKNRERMQKRKAHRAAAARRSKRRGVLLLVVLSMLVLFMLVGTAFLMSSNQARIASKDQGKLDRLGNYATQLLDRALLQIVRDTANPNSVIRYHSLLGDLYGTDGFQGVVYSPGTMDLGVIDGQVTRFAGAIIDDSSTTSFREDMGSTNGQFIDIYVSVKPYKAIDYSTSYVPVVSNNPTINTSLELRNVLKLDRNPYGQPQPYPLPLTKGYFNGCLLTMTSGPASGQSARILDYEYVGDADTNANTEERLFRFRVMAFQRTDGQQLQIDSPTITKSRNPELNDLAGQSFMVNGRAFSGTGVGYNPLANSGQPPGTTGQPRLSALQLFPIPFGTPNPDATTTHIGAELALLPNSVYFRPLSTAIGAAPFTIPSSDPLKPILVEPFTMPLPLGSFQSLNAPPLGNFAGRFLYPNFPGSGGSNEGYDAPDFQNIGLALQTVTPRSQGRVVHSDGANPPVTLELSDPLVWNGSQFVDTDKFLRLDLEDVPIPSFHRPDLVNFWNHRLLKYLVQGGMQPDDAVRAIVQPYSDDKWTVNAAANGLTAQNAALISAIKRQIMLRPTREDHPHFDGNNPQSIPPSLAGTTPLQVGGNIAIPTWEVVGPADVDNDNDGVRDSNWVDLGDSIQITEDGRRYKPLYAILCIDLDSRLNVNAHGLAEDLHMPHYIGNSIQPPLIGIVETPPGSGLFTAVRPSLEYGFISQLKPDPAWPPDPYTQPQPISEFAFGGNNLAGQYGSLNLARGLGYGPAEISLRPIFPIPIESYDATFKPRYDFRGNRSELSTPRIIDSYAALLVGREKEDKKAVSGRYGYRGQAVSATEDVTPGNNYQYTPFAVSGTTIRDDREPDLATQIKFFEYPWRQDYSSAFGTPPDLHGRYGLGLDYAGQPFYEPYFDRNPFDPAPGILNNPAPIFASLLTDIPYESDLSSSRRRDSWASRTNAFGPMSSSSSAFATSLDQNDDSAFSPTDLEKVLRRWDHESGTLPSRLWDVVNDFDPIKLINFDPNRVQITANLAFGSTSDSAQLAAAQQIAGINSRLVTTDSFDLPVANQTMPGYVSEFGADGVPGRRKPLPTDPPDALNTPGSDDFQVIMALRDVVPITQGVTRSKAKISDLLYYRIWLEARKTVMTTQDLTEGRLATLSNAEYAQFLGFVGARTGFVFGRLPSDLLAPEVLAGKRMDLNRPFGNGKDDNSDGVVDDPLEAGEPFLDVDGNGTMTFNTSGVALEPFIDLNGDKNYQGPGDKLWPQLAPVAVGGDGTLGEPISFDYTNGHAEPIADVAIQIATTVSLSGAVRNLDSHGRQIYARHLYCLMLLLMDENYIAPWDENDPQINKLLDMTITGSYAQRLRAAIGGIPSPALTAPQYDAIARGVLLRKLTCRTIAQWAVNCVDMRDPDVIMTAFEYDENPWDGWGVWTDNSVGENSNASFIKVKPVPSKPPACFIPLDGDAATNENDAWVIDWRLPAPPSPARTKTLLQLRSDLTVPASPTNPPFVTHPYNQTRGVVWGAERPELLITETLAWHDRRTVDSSGTGDGKHGTLKETGATRYPDVDMDQHLRPKGSLFVELYNPWSPTGQFPAELYTRLDSTDWDKVNNRYKLTPTPGVDLSRLSNWGVSEFYDNSNITNPSDARLADRQSGTDSADNTRIIKRSPVWRQIVVEDWPRARNRDRATIGNPQSQTGAAGTVEDVQQFPNYRQRVGDAPPEVKPNQPAGMPPAPPDDPSKPPAYYSKMIGAATIPNTVEGWDATQPPPYRAPDPDFDEVFNAGFTPTQVPQGASNAFPNMFNVEYPYIEREFYFTTDDSPIVRLTGDSDNWGQFITEFAGAVRNRMMDWDYSPKNFKIRVPDRYIKLSGVTGGPPVPTDPSGLTHWARSQKFIPISLEKQKSYKDLDLSTLRLDTEPKPQVISPIPPGRYGVIGSAGTRYFKDPPPANQNIYTSPIGRPVSGEPDGNTSDGRLKSDLEKTRRIEMRLAKNPANPLPDQQQLVIASNGGDPKDQIQKGSTYDPFTLEIGRDNELIRNDTTSPSSVLNLTEPDANGKAKFYQPCVAIPVEGMSASEPPWGWAPREVQAAGQEADIRKREKTKHDAVPGASPWPDVTPDAPVYNPEGANGEGAYGEEASQDSYDKPFDLAPELTRTGTTPNYRTTHLQRLANPQLPWNPLPGQYKDAAGTDLYRPNLPVNPYRTIDSSTINLTAFNGTSSEEPFIGNNDGLGIAEGKLRPWQTGGISIGGQPEIDTYVKGLRGADELLNSAKQAFAFRSVERGFWSRLNVAGWLGYPGAKLKPPSSVNPAGVPAKPKVDPTNPGVSVPQRILWAQEPALVDLRKPLPLDDDEPAQLLDLINGRQMTMRMFDEVPRGPSTQPPTNQASFGTTMDDLYGSPTAANPSGQNLTENHCDMVLKHSLGFGNESFGLLYDRRGSKRSGLPVGSPPGAPNSMTSSSPPIIAQSAGVALPTAVGAPAPGRFVFPYDLSPTGDVLANPPPDTINSTYPWLAWDNRPYISGDEVLKVPAASQSQMLRMYAANDVNLSTMDWNVQPIDPNDANLPKAKRRNPYGLSLIPGLKNPPPNLGSKIVPATNALRWAAMHAPFGALANVFASSAEVLVVQQGTLFLPSVADVVRDPTGVPIPQGSGNDVLPFGAPNFSRILEYVQVPSRFVGTDTVLNAETFNDATPSATFPTEPVGFNITGPADPRWQFSGRVDPQFYFQPPFNKVSRERDPGRVNLNTVTGRRTPGTPAAPTVPQIWSEVYDGIMHRFRDGELASQNQLSHFGPAWRDVVLSRRGYVQVDAAGTFIDKPNAASAPDTLEFGLNNNFPTLFANPFRSPDAGDLVPLVQMMQSGVDASMDRVHPRTRGAYTNVLGETRYDFIWGGVQAAVTWPAGYTPFNDARDAGFCNDLISYRGSGAIPNDDVTQRDTVPLFSDVRTLPSVRPDRLDVSGEPFTDPNRNPYMMYEPMSRLRNLVTNRSGVYAIWITVGYFEVEKAPDWNDPNTTVRTKIREHFGGTINDTDPATIAALALYNRAYPDGYMLGKELGNETGDVKRPRGFYIIDRTEEVGFKPGEDLNVEKTIRLRRRIE